MRQEEVRFEIFIFKSSLTAISHIKNQFDLTYMVDDLVSKPFLFECQV